jgi:hypothetical protein
MFPLTITIETPQGAGEAVQFHYRGRWTVSLPHNVNFEFDGTQQQLRGEIRRRYAGPSPECDLCSEDAEYTVTTAGGKMQVCYECLGAGATDANNLETIFGSDHGHVINIQDRS